MVALASWPSSGAVFMASVGWADVLTGVVLAQAARVWNSKALRLLRTDKATLAKSHFGILLKCNAKVHRICRTRLIHRTSSLDDEASGVA